MSEPPGLEAGQAYRSRPHPDALAAKEPLAYSDPDRLWLRAEYRFRLCELAVCGRFRLCKLALAALPSLVRPAQNEKQNQLAFIINGNNDASCTWGRPPGLNPLGGQSRFCAGLGEASAE